jgi:hypothetical protein
LAFFPPVAAGFLPLAGDRFLWAMQSKWLLPMLREKVGMYYVVITDSLTVVSAAKRGSVDFLLTK